MGKVAGDILTFRIRGPHWMLRTNKALLRWSKHLPMSMRRLRWVIEDTLRVQVGGPPEIRR